MTKKKARSAFGNYKNIKMIIENMHGIDFMTAREIRRREWDSMQVEASKEVALKAKQRDAKRKGSTILEPTGTCSMEFFSRCDKRGHKQDDCYQRNNQKRDSSRNDHAFMATTAQHKKAGRWTAVVAVI